MHTPDVLFYCNANATVGFGHLRRCMFLGQRLQTERRKIAYAGDIDAEGRRLLHDSLPDATYHPALDNLNASVGVIDVMFDPYDAECYDATVIRHVARHADTSVLLTSARTAPDSLPVDMVVGHLLADASRRTYDLKSGLEYAPVDPSVCDVRPATPPAPRPLERVFVAFGNWGDPAGLFLVLEALAEQSFRGDVEVLLPSALESHKDDLAALDTDAPYTLTLRHAVPSVPELLVDADLAIGTYGHVTYESMAVGTPFLIVGVKPFMVDYGTDLATSNLAACAGLVETLRPSDLADQVAALSVTRRDVLSRQGWESLDGRGLIRTAQVLSSLSAAQSGSFTGPGTSTAGDASETASNASPQS